MKVRKEIIREGTTAYVDGNGQTRFLTATPDRLKYWHDTGIDMLASKLSIPVPYEHDPTATPLTPAEKLLNNAGYVESFELGHVEEEVNGQKVSKNALFSTLDIRDEKVQGKIKDGTVAWTSPWFTSFVDGQGKQRSGVFGHIALTTRPRIVGQQPFQAAFSLKPEQFETQVPDGAILSNAGLLCEPQPGVFKPLFPVAFSLFTGAKFAFPEEKEKPEKKEGGNDSSGKSGGDSGEKKPEGGDKEGGDKPPFGKNKDGKEGAGHKFDPMTGEPIKQPLVDPDGDVSVWCVVADMLSMLLGVDFGEDITEENGLEKIYETCREAMKTKMASGNDSTGAKDPTQTDPAYQPPPGKKNPIIQEQQPMYMSLEKVNSYTDPVMKEIALSLLKSQEDAAAEKKRREALEQNAFAVADAKRQQRIKQLKRFLPAEDAKALDDMAAGAKFSMDDQGVVFDPLAATLSLQEKLLANIPALLKAQPGAKFSVESQPEETAGGMPQARLEEVRKQYEKAAGVA